VQVVLAGCLPCAVNAPSQPSPLAAPVQSGLPVPDEPSRWFSEQVHAHDGRLKAYLRGSFPSVRDFDDLVQESYLRVWRRQLDRPIASARAFLFKVARNLALDALRHERASPIERVTDFPVSDVIDDGPGVVETVCTNQEVELLFQAIQKLPARCRQIVIMRKIQGLAQKEIALRLGISESTVQVQASRGLQRCEEFLRERGVIQGRQP
jgi:RNA polymerase sigma factor (sigma-70 family)